MTNTLRDLREIEVFIDETVFGFRSQVTGQLNGISAVRIRDDGTVCYLPEYARSMNDAMQVLYWCREHGGKALVWTEGDDWKCRLIWNGEKFESSSDRPELSIAEAAKLLGERKVSLA